MRLDCAIAGLVLGLLTMVPASFSKGSDEAEDRDAIARQRERFLTSWLADDREAVLDCFTDDAILVPHAGAPAVVTKEKIRSFYWSGPPATVHEFTMKPSSEIRLEGAMAYEYGRYTVAYEFLDDAKVTKTEGNYVSIWRKTKGGVWRYALRTWNHN